MVDINTEKLTNKIQEYRDDGKSCSQSVLTAICTELDCQLNENQLLGLGKGFSGGVITTSSQNNILILCVFNLPSKV